MEEKTAMKKTKTICPTCSCEVTVKSTDEGTSYYVPVSAPQREDGFLKVEVGSSVSTDICPVCNGYGFTAEHDPTDPHDEGVCLRCPIQVPCEPCNGTGKVLPRQSVSTEDIIEMIDERIKYLDTIVERGIDQRWYLGGKDELIQLRSRITAKEKGK